ncbi:solute carrier family 41 member 1-like isoform X1 [Plodia interpunctella]|uniref:solute carrier family 41 member 1-like isoform X1 n=1 Tax=Plodia interpunctella TaxID=58824 RepID=UPI002368CC12|nr:solute carrier family 41 member 1-like isoform X1 [Plodia interpunctella]XP_053619305.1 solute carrier family 41 member 1-like isoform X1 [Plodia interpunctella]
MVGAPDVVKPSEKVDDQSPHVNSNPVFTISNDIGGQAYTMSSINAELKSPGDPPDKKLADSDAEKQPLSGPTRIRGVVAGNSSGDHSHRCLIQEKEEDNNDSNENDEDDEGAERESVTDGPVTELKKEERWWNTLMQVAVPFFIAGCGTIGAGLVLGTVKDWDVFVNVSAIFVLVPSLSGLKGNLDMCLASRLSTQANLGNMESSREVISMVVGNVSLVQVQAIVASTVVSIFAIVVNTITDRQLNGNYILLIIASAVFTATTTCFVLDFVMVMVIYGSHKFKVNPDNVATPLAASIGDIVSNSVLAVTAQYMYEQIRPHSADRSEVSLWQPITLMCVYYSLLPLWVFVVYRNKYTKKVLTTGWTPVISALFISGIGGIVLDQAVDQYPGYEVFQPIVNGIGGNLVCVQSSRLATHLHQTAIPGVLPEDTRIVEWPWKTLFFGTAAAKVARMLLVLAVFGQIIFMIVADFVFQGVVTIQPAFGITYVMCSLLQVMVLLYLAYMFIHLMWKKKKDPDNAAIPYLTALGDLLGSVFLGLAFVILSIFGMQYGSNTQ